MKRFVKVLCCIITVITLLVVSVSCGVSGAKYDTLLTGEGINVRMSAVASEIDKYEVSDFVLSKQKSDFVLITVKNYGEIVVALRSDIAPITVNNFKSLVDKKFYDGMVFHRVIENFMIQGGGYAYVGNQLAEKDAAEIKGEFTDNGVINNLAHVRGVISMARIGGVNDSASSQFFIMHQANANLDKQYASFGYVLAGMSVVDAIAVCECEGDANAPVPVDPVIIESIVFVQPK